MLLHLHFLRLFIFSYGGTPSSGTSHLSPHLMQLYSSKFFCPTCNLSGVPPIILPTNPIIQLSCLIYHAHAQIERRSARCAAYNTHNPFNLWRRDVITSYDATSSICMGFVYSTRLSPRGISICLNLYVGTLCYFYMLSSWSSLIVW